LRIGDARTVAARWVREHGAGTPGFAGAFLNGSTACLPAAALPVGSDVDITVVVSGEHPPDKPGKVWYGGLVVEASYTTWAELPSAETVLCTHYLAGAFRAPGTVLADPAGRLSELAAAVACDFARRPWVRRRCASTKRRIVYGLDRLDALAVPEVIPWVFPTGITTHVLLTAGLRNPTVRRRYADVRDLLARYGRLDFHEELLRLPGCAELSRDRVEYHLRGMTDVLSAVGPVTDIPAAVDGGRDLVERGLHREAVFWIVVTYARCAAAGGDRAGLAELLSDLGVSDPDDLRRRGREVRAFLPRLRAVAEQLMAANPEIRD
jgi:hypothetical protein